MNQLTKDPTLPGECVELEPQRYDETSALYKDESVLCIIGASFQKKKFRHLKRTLSFLEAVFAICVMWGF